MPGHSTKHRSLPGPFYERLDKLQLIILSLEIRNGQLLIHRGSANVHPILWLHSIFMSAEGMKTSSPSLSPSYVNPASRSHPSISHFNFISYTAYHVPWTFPYTHCRILKVGNNLAKQKSTLSRTPVERTWTSRISVTQFRIFSLSSSPWCGMSDLWTAKVTTHVHIK